MKPLAPYFGNRLASVAAKKSNRRVSEMEALESRVLLSGISADPTKSYKKVTYTDLDGDKVTLSLSKGTFKITADVVDNVVASIDSIVLDGTTTSSIFKATVAKVKKGSEANGSTEINQISATTAAVAVKSIVLDGAHVADISMSNTVIGSAYLKATSAVALDRWSDSGNTGATESVNWGNVTAKGLTTIQSAVVTVAGSGNNGEALNFDGAISVSEGSVSVIGTNSELIGILSAHTVKNVNVKSISGGITTIGDLTLKVNNGVSLGTGTYTVGANLHLGVLSGGLGAATFDVTGSISGADSTLTTDVVSVNGSIAGASFKAGTSFAGLTVTGGNATIAALTATSIGAITVAQGSYTGNLTTDGAIGNITVRDAFTGSITSNDSSIGNIVADRVSGNVAAATSIGNITLDGAASTGNITAGAPVAGAVAASGGNIGNITAAGDVGAITAYNGSIGTVTVSGGGDITSITAGTANTVAFAATGGAIGNITMTGAGSDLGAVTAYNGNIGVISIADGAISGAITSGSILSGTNALTGGNIGNITIANSTTNQTALQANIAALNGTVGNITVTNTYAAASALTGGLSILGSSIGAISISAAPTSASSFDATAFTTLTVGSTNTAANTSQVGTGMIGAISITGDITTLTLQGRATGGGYVGALVGNVSIGDDDAADTSAVVYTNVNTAGNLALSNGSLTVTQNGNLMTAIGNISAGSALSGLTLGSSLATIGNLTTGGAANISGLTASTLTTIGNVSVGGALTFGASDLSSLVSVGTFAVQSFAAGTAGQTIGASVANAGLSSATPSIGLITVTSSAVAAGAPDITFNFGKFNGLYANSATTIATVASTNVSATQAFAGATVVGDITFTSL